MSANWLILSIITIVASGIVGFAIKLAFKYSNWAEIYVVEMATLFGLSLLVLVSQRPAINVGSPGFNLALIAGIMATVGSIAIYLALQAGNAMVVIPLTSIYPVVTIILSYFILHEHISPVKWAGVVLALIALVLIALD
jgi:transporter family protein